MARFPDPEDRHVLAADCRRCPALVESRGCIAWGNGPSDATLVVVGEAPAVGDPDADCWQGGNLTGMAYTSRRSGRKVRQLVANLGFENEAYYTNAVKCFPADPDDRTDNREPTPEERANCHPYLVEEVETVAPLAVLDPVDCPTLGTTLVPILHPSYEEVWRARLGYDDRADTLRPSARRWQVFCDLRGVLQRRFSTLLRSDCIRVRRLRRA